MVQASRCWVSRSYVLISNKPTQCAGLKNLRGTVGFSRKKRQSRVLSCTDSPAPTSIALKPSRMLVGASCTHVYMCVCVFGKVALLGPSLVKPTWLHHQDYLVRGVVRTFSAEYSSEICLTYFRLRCHLFCKRGWELGLRIAADAPATPP